MSDSRPVGPAGGAGRAPGSGRVDLVRCSGCTDYNKKEDKCPRCEARKALVEFPGLQLYLLHEEAVPERLKAKMVRRIEELLESGHTCKECDCPIARKYVVCLVCQNVLDDKCPRCKKPESKSKHLDLCKECHHKEVRHICADCEKMTALGDHKICAECHKR